MDVQTENMDPPPCESQPSGKIRKGFKLFGKRKPGNIFSIRSKGDGNNKSPVHRSKTLDGLSESPAPDSEQELDKEKGQEVSEAEKEQAEEEQLGEDGVLAAAPARNSVSSASSAKSLSFLSLLRGGRRGVGDRRVHTVSQPVGRQRRGLKGLFGNVKFKSKDKEEKEELPPSPLLMSSRANSVEIIKEDLTLTPKSQPRSLDSPETERREHVKSATTLDSATPSPPETATSQVTTSSVSKTHENVAPSPTLEPPLVPGDTSLSSLLADISSLLTFDSITGGGDIMADVEAEWGKASSAISAVVTEVTPTSTSPFSKPTISSPLSPTKVSTASTAKPSHVAVPTATSLQPFTALSKATTTSSPISKPSTTPTTFTKSSTLTTPSVKLSSDSTPASEPSVSAKTITALAPTTTKPSAFPVTSTNLSAPTSSFVITSKSTVMSISTATTAPPNTPASVVKAPSVSPVLTSTASKLASQTVLPPQTTTSVSKPSLVATSPPVSTKPSSITHSPPIPVAISQPPPAKSNSISTSCKPSLISVTVDSKTPVTVSPACTVTTKPSSPDPGTLSKTAAPTSAATSASASGALFKPTLTSTLTEQNKSPPSHVTAPDICPPTAKTQPSPASITTPASVSSAKLPPATKPTSASVLLDKTPPTLTPIPALATHAAVSTASTALGHIPVSLSKDQPAPAQLQISQSKTPPAPVQVPVSIYKDQPAPAQKEPAQSKTPPAPVEVPLYVCKDQPAPAQMEAPQSKTPPAPAQPPVTVYKDLPAPAQKVPQSKPPPTSVQIPASASKDPSAPAQQEVFQSKPPPALAKIPVSVSTDSPAPISVAKPLSTSGQIPVSQPKAHPVPPGAPCPVTSLPPTPKTQPSEAPASAKSSGSGLATVDSQLASPNGTNGEGVKTAPCKTEEPHKESRTSLQEPPREKRTQAKASGLSKIPVVGGSRVGRLPVRDSQQHADEESNRNPPTPVLEEERPHFNSHDAGNKDKISAAEATSKHTQEDSQHPQHQKVLTSSARDSKIPVKHGAQTHTASQVPQTKEPPRTKIPVSKVPVRRAGTKPAATGGSAQIRK